MSPEEKELHEQLENSLANLADFIGEIADKINPSWRETTTVSWENSWKKEGDSYNIRRLKLYLFFVNNLIIYQKEHIARINK